MAKQFSVKNKINWKVVTEKSLIIYNFSGSNEQQEAERNHENIGNSPLYPFSPIILCILCQKTPETTQTKKIALFRKLPNFIGEKKKDPKAIH